MKCKVMGIVNVTPDSFSDGGRYFEPAEAIRRARNLIEDGADIIDLGGESTRPGATPIGWEEEWRRLEPVIAGLGIGAHGLGGKRRTVLTSVDTYHPETAARAIAAGVGIINCVYAEPVPEMAQLLAGNSVELVLPSSALSRLPDPDALLPRLYLDPMIGFGTTREEDVELLRSIPELAKKGRVLIGASRKRIVKKLTGEKLTGKNLGGNLGIAVWAALQGASVVRVHDVRETVQALGVIGQLEGEG
ncbi:MAG: dihydropteroate synthase [Kiritimatiellia bacterium]